MSEECYYCGSIREIQDDHVYPDRDSIVPACRACNQSKSDSTPAEWLDRIIREDRYRWKKIKLWNYRKRNWFAQLVHKRMEWGY